MKRIGIVPFDDSFRSDQILEFRTEHDIGNVFYVLGRTLRTKYIVHTIDYFSSNLNEVDLVIFLGLDYLVLSKVIFFNIPCIYITIESPVIEGLHSDLNLLKFESVFHKVLTWNDKLLGRNRFTKINLPARSSSFYQMRSDEFHKKLYLVTQFSNNLKKNSNHNELYSIRTRINQEFIKLMGDDFHYYGQGCVTDGLGYKGYAEDKILTLNNYKFAFCLENAVTDYGYVSEKIFDAFIGRSVPIYLGYTRIDTLIPENTFIDLRKYSSFSELYDYISSMEESEYMEYLKAADDFFSTSSAQKFFPEYFANEIVKEVDLVFYNEDFESINAKFSSIYIYIFCKGIFGFARRIIKCLLSSIGVERFKCYRN